MLWFDPPESASVLPTISEGHSAVIPTTSLKAFRPFVSAITFRFRTREPTGCRAKFHLLCSHGVGDVAAKEFADDLSNCKDRRMSGVSST